MNDFVNWWIGKKLRWHDTGNFLRFRGSFSSCNRSMQKKILPVGPLNFMTPLVTEKLVFRWILTSNEGAVVCECKFSPYTMRKIIGLNLKHAKKRCLSSKNRSSWHLLLLTWEPFFSVGNSMLMMFFTFSDISISVRIQFGLNLLVDDLYRSRSNMDHPKALDFGF